MESPADIIEAAQASLRFDSLQLGNDLPRSLWPHLAMIIKYGEPCRSAAGSRVVSLPATQLEFAMAVSRSHSLPVHIVHKIVAMSLFL